MVTLAIYALLANIVVSFHLLPGVMPETTDLNLESTDTYKLHPWSYMISTNAALSSHSDYTNPHMGATVKQLN